MSGISTTKLSKLASIVDDLEDLGFIAELYSLSMGEKVNVNDYAPQEKQERVFAALLRIIRDMASSAPVFMLFEDIHWMDPKLRTTRFVNTAHRSNAAALCITFRPEFHAAWTGQANVTSITLNRLGLQERST